VKEERCHGLIDVGRLRLDVPPRLGDCRRQGLRHLTLDAADLGRR